MGQKQKKKNLLSENILGTGRSLGITFTHLIVMTVIGKYGRNKGLKEFAISEINWKEKNFITEKYLVER